MPSASPALPRPDERPDRTWPPEPHDPRARCLLDEVAGWQVLCFARNDPRHAWLAAKGMLHLQLWQETLRISVLTPSRLSDGRLELWTEDERVRICCWPSLSRRLAARGVPLPPRCEVHRMEQFFLRMSEIGVTALR